MSLLDTLDPVLIPWAYKLLELAQAAGVHPTVTSARRSYAQQAMLYQRYQEGRNRFPAALPGTSAHELGLAFDMVVPNPTDQADLGIVWARWGGVYGGTYDPVHFEYPFTRANPIALEKSESPLDRIGGKVQTLVDYVVAAAPSPLRGILNSLEVATAVSSIAGNPLGPGMEWMLTHPAEVTSAFLAAAWKAAASNVRF